MLNMCWISVNLVFDSELKLCYNITVRRGERKKFFTHAMGAGSCFGSWELEFSLSHRRKLRPRKNFTPRVKNIQPRMGAGYLRKKPSFQTHTTRVVCEWTQSRPVYQVLELQSSAWQKIFFSSLRKLVEKLKTPANLRKPAKKNFSSKLHWEKIFFLRKLIENLKIPKNFGKIF